MERGIQGTEVLGARSLPSPLSFCGGVDSIIFIFSLLPSSVLSYLQISGPHPIKWESLPLPLYLLHYNVGFPPFPCLRKREEARDSLGLSASRKPLPTPSFLSKYISAPSVPIWKGMCCHLNIIPRRRDRTPSIFWQTSHLFCCCFPHS